MPRKVAHDHRLVKVFTLCSVEAIAQPNRILEGGDGEFLAVRQQESERFLIVVYRELGQDGFIITAFLTSKINALSRRRQIWP